MIAKIKHRIHISILILFASFIFAQLGCKDEDEERNIPLVEVYFDININDPDYINLQTIGGWEYVTGGSRGIIIYRSANNLFKAYDRHCTFQPSSTCALVSVDASNLTASDVCCGSSFLLINGSVTRPPAALPLNEYVTSFDGTILTIRN